MRNMVRNSVLALVSVGLLAANDGWSYPSLQLDIAGGTYDPVSQTIVASGNPFTVYALFDTSGGATPAGSYFISAAIIPQTSSGSFGSFKVGSTTYSVGGGNMQYGTPPVDTAFPDLPPHGIFPTEYAEIGFSFNSANKATAYNTADNPGGFVANASGAFLYQAFTFDITGITAGTIVHIDLYDEIVKTHPKDATDTDFAPFSHDAQSGTGGGGDNKVPDGGATLALLGSAVIGLGILRRKITKN